jgi:beta-N-acetylhexosaminidase
MLSHARLTALDPERPVSFSRAVVSGLLRQTWRHDGVLITDDFSMAAAYGDKEGIAATGTAALNAGVDLILIAYDPAQYFAVMDGLLAADRDGVLSATTLARSARRLEEVETSR